MSESDTVEVSRETFDRILEKLDEYEERFDDIEDDVEENTERIDDVEAEQDEMSDHFQRERAQDRSRITELENNVEELEGNTEELESTQDDHGMRLDAMSDWNDDVKDEIADLKDFRTDVVEPRLDDLNKPVAVGAGASVNEIDRDELTLVEKYAEMPSEERAEVLPASQRRAVVIYEYWNEWSRKGRTGRSLRTANVRSKLETVEKERTGTDVRLESKQVLRAADELERLSEERIQKNKCPGGDYLRLVQDEGDTFPSRDTAASKTGVTASSASA